MITISITVPETKAVTALAQKYFLKACSWHSDPEVTTMKVML